MFAASADAAARRRSDSGGVQRNGGPMSTTATGITSERLIGPIAAAIAVGATAVANLFVSGDESGSATIFAGCAVVTLAVAALLFGRVVPRAKEGNPARVGLVLAALSVLTLLVFWSGLPQILAPAAIVLGLAAPRSGESIAAVAIGSLAYAASLVGAVIG